MKKIVWGLLIIAAVVCIILESLGVNIGFVGDLPIIDLIITTILIAVCICIIIDFNFPLLPFPVAVAFFVLEDNIAEWAGRPDEDLLSTWLVILCAVAMSIALSLIFSKFKKHTKSTKNTDSNAKFGEHTKYFDASQSTFFYSVKMCEGNVYFENISRYCGDGVLTVDVNMGELIINVPKAWTIKEEISCSLGNISTPQNMVDGGPTLTINGKCKLGDVSIRFCD